jgi:ferredoxin
VRIEADRDVCIGAGMCALTAPDVFDQNTDDGRVVLLMERPADETAAAAREAVYLCPSGALTLREDDE